MAQTETFDPILMLDNREALRDNPFPGRGIILGLTPNGEQLVQVYWDMGLDSNSRNRVLARNELNVVHTEPFDPASVEDPSLIIYNAMRTKYANKESAVHVVSNGDQTDSVFAAISHLDVENSVPTFREALLGLTYEPDFPNYTPKITGIFAIIGASQQFAYNIIRRGPTGAPEHSFGNGDVSDIPAGAGMCFHTSEGKDEGKPLPPFAGTPYGFPLEDSAPEIAESVWSVLNPENRVALAVKTIDRTTGRHVDFDVINQLEQV